MENYMKNGIRPLLPDAVFAVEGTSALLPDPRAPHRAVKKFPPKGNKSGAKYLRIRPFRSVAQHIAAERETLPRPGFRDGFSFVCPGENLVIL